MEQYVKINLKDIYPDQYKEDYFILVSQAVANFIIQHDRRYRADERQDQRYQSQAYLGSDRFLFKNGCCYERLEDAIEKQLDQQQLYLALNKLPEVQAKRIYAHYFLGISMRRIALNEGVSEQAVGQSIGLALGKLKLFLENL